MTLLWGGYVTAIALGVMGSLGPCTVATNVAAIGFITRHASSGGNTAVWRSGLAYAAGRGTVFALLGTALSFGILRAAALSHHLQHWGGLLLGPVCVLTGMGLLDMLPVPGFGGRLVDIVWKRANPARHLHAYALGVAFALAVCPVCAALFFGSLLPLSVAHDAPLAYPVLFGLGSALPVVLVASLGTAGASALTRASGGFAVTERLVRQIVAALFIVAGVFLTFEFAFDIHLHPGDHSTSPHVNDDHDHHHE